MKFQVPDRVMVWLGPAAIAAFGAILIFGNPITSAALCDAASNCIATWVDALSGWAAAVAAAVTVRSLYSQASAQQKQTEFQLGDASPTVDAVQHADKRDRVILRVRNWNRRSMIVRRLRLVTDQEIAAIFVAFPEHKNSRLSDLYSRGWVPGRGPALKFDPALMIEGWVLREEAPPLLKLRISAFLSGQILVENQWDQVPIEIQYELVGVRKIYREIAYVHLAATAIDVDEDAIDRPVADEGENA